MCTPAISGENPAENLVPAVVSEAAASVRPWNPPWNTTMSGRPSGLLSVTRGRVAPEDQLITVTRKGSRALQPLPASTDAFVWLRLYQHEMRHLIAAGPDDPLSWTLCQPVRPLTYDAARMVFNRANTVVGSNWTLHDLRHAAAIPPRRPTRGDRLPAPTG